MSKKILDSEIVREELEKEDGIIFGLEGDDAKNFLFDKWGCNFNIESSWAEGDEDLIIYTETTSDGYDLWICTDEHNGTRNIGEDVYYYEDNESFMERAIDCLRCGGSVWIDSYIAENMEYEMEEAWRYAYEDEYDGLFENKKDELLDKDYDEYRD